MIDPGRLFRFADEVSEMLFGCGSHRQFEDAHSVQIEAVSVSPTPTSSSQNLSLRLTTMSVHVYGTIGYVSFTGKE